MLLELAHVVPLELPLANRTREQAVIAVAVMHEEVVVQGVHVFAGEIRAANGARKRAVVMLQLAVSPDRVGRGRISATLVRANQHLASLLPLLLLDNLETLQVVGLELQRLSKVEPLLAVGTRQELV